MTESRQEGVSIAPSTPSVGQWQPLAQVGRAEKRVRKLPALLAVAVLLLVATGFAIWQFRLLPSGGQIGAIERGTLSMRSGEGEAWAQRQQGETLEEGALLRGQPGAVVTLHFADGSLCRIESAGEWQILELRRSRNGRLSRTAIHHLDGQASYMSRAPQPAVDARLLISLPTGVSLDLIGVATVMTIPDGTARIQLLQGRGQLQAWERDLGLSPGQIIVLDVDARSILSE
ncbi:MAG: hypothetical protein JXA74_14575 [Anaerolineae bacterium]|nr:hypothetical protein [Anaerolineae bacterium]